MTLIALKCPQCNADLTVDSSRDFLYCEYCGAKVVKDKPTHVTNNYTTKTINNVTYADGHERHTADWYYKTWQGLLERKRYDDADELFEEFKREYPLDSRVEDELKAQKREEWADFLKQKILYPVILAIIIFIIYLIAH